MNKIDEVVRLLNINVNDIGNIVKYTRDETISSKNIDSFRCYNDDTYIEIVFWVSSLCLGGYMSLAWYEENPVVAKEVSELLYTSSINDFHESDFIKALEEKYINNKEEIDLDGFEEYEEISFDDESKEFVESVIESIYSEFLRNELSVLRFVAFTYQSWRTVLEIHRKQYDSGRDDSRSMDFDDERNLTSTEMAQSVSEYVNDKFVDVDEE